MNILILMAIFQSTAFSKLRNSFGNLTTYRSKGQNIVKEKVTEIKNPKTLKQQKQRTLFHMLVKLTEILSQPIALGLINKEEKQTPANYFVRLNKEAVTVDDKLQVTVDYENLCISKGLRAMPDISAILNTEERSLEIQVETESFESHAADDDEFFCCVVEKAMMKSKLFLLGERSELSSKSLQLPEAWEVSKANLVVYVFCVSKDRTRPGNSVCVPLA